MSKIKNAKSKSNGPACQECGRKVKDATALTQFGKKLICDMCLDDKKDAPPAKDQKIIKLPSQPKAKRSGPVNATDGTVAPRSENPSVRWTCVQAIQASPEASNEVLAKVCLNKLPQTDNTAESWERHVSATRGWMFRNGMGDPRLARKAPAKAKAKAPATAEVVEDA
jgi:hypothetical protein